MSANILDIINTEEKQELVITALNGYITKCKSIAKKPLQGYGKASEKEKKQQWHEKANQAQLLLNELIVEFN